MKTKLLTFALLSSLLLSAHAESVYSNAVGLIKFTVDTGAFSFVNVPFDSQDSTDLTVEKVFGDSLPSSSQVLAWNTGSQAYETSTFAPVFGGWTNPNLVLNRARGFFLMIPDNNGETFDVVLSGNVPNDHSIDSSVVPGFQFVGYPYPVATKISEMTLTTEAQSGDVLYVWDAESGWVSSTYAPVFGGWTVDLTIEPGTAFMYKSNNARTTVETQPYSLN